MKIGITLLIISFILNIAGLIWLNRYNQELDDNAAFSLSYSEKLQESSEVYNIMDNFIKNFNNQDLDNIKKLLNSDFEVVDVKDFLIFKHNDIDQHVRKTAFNIYSYHSFRIEQSSAQLALQIRNQFGTGYIYFDVAKNNGEWKIISITS